MKNTKMLKAYCKKTGQKFGIEVAKQGLSWRAVDFIPITDEEASLMTSEVKQARFETNSNLLPCLKCGGRTIGGCACAPRSFQCRKGVYNFQCIYCKELEIDYSAATLVGGHRSGDVIRLSQGQIVKINVEEGKPLKKIEVGVGWDPVSSGDNMDIDSTVFVVGENGMETVYFGNLKHPSGCVHHHGDNLTGEDKANSDDENITVHLDKVPRDRDRLIFVINIYNCSARGQTLGNVRNMYIRLYDPASRRPLIEYRVDQKLYGDTALVIGMAFRDGQGWQFKAIGKGSRATSISALETECRPLRP